jgi:hypothetical protein
MLCGEVHILSDVNATTTLVLEEIIHLFNTLYKGHIEIMLGGKEFQYYRRRVWERMSSSISIIYFEHYKSATYSTMITNFLAWKTALIARCGCPLERWGHGLQVLLEKIADVALVTKL